jgi:transposase, IS5 family
MKCAVELRAKPRRSRCSSSRSITSTVIIDTTVMEKAVAHPTDSRLLDRCREHLVKAAARHGLKLRQNYDREAQLLGLQIGRYTHAKQYRRVRKALRTLRSRVGRVMRDVERQVAQVADSDRAALQELIDRTKRILPQKPKDKNKLYALHAPEVECLAKGKARRPYEFGVKVSITTIHKEGLVVVGMRSPKRWSRRQSCATPCRRSPSSTLDTRVSPSTR